MSDPIIEMIPVAALRPWAKNARTHSKKQVRQIADSIRTFGFTNPVLIDASNSILAGHGRVAAATLLDMQQVPCLRLEHMTHAQKRAYVLADHKLALNAGWDDEVLAEELRALLEIDLDFDVEVTGFSIAEIDSLVEGLIPEEPGDPDDDLLPGIDTTPRCRPGDIWQLGAHRLICGSALDKATVDALMAGEKAQMVFTDPPYNVPIDGHVGGSGKIKHREFAMASGEMSTDEFTTFLSTGFRNLADASVDGSIPFICMDWRHMGEMIRCPQSSLQRTEEPHGVGEGQWWRGNILPIPPRTRLAFKHGSAPTSTRSSWARTGATVPTFGNTPGEHAADRANG